MASTSDNVVHTNTNTETRNDPFSETNLKQSFETQLIEYDDSHPASSRSRWSNDRISEVIEQVKNYKDTSCHRRRRASKNYYWIKKYDVITEENEDFLIFKKLNINEPTIKILPREQYFDYLKVIHLSGDHAGRDKMVSIIKNQYYAPKVAVQLYVSLCPKCSQRSIVKKTLTNRQSIASDHVDQEPQVTTFPVVVEESLANPNNLCTPDVSCRKARARLDIIDFQSTPDGGYKWLLTYQNYATRRINLRPLKTNEANEVASELTKIFLAFQAPKILDCDMGCDFTANVIEGIASLLPSCHVIHGNCLAPGIKRNDDNQDIEDIRTSMKDCGNWSVRCWYVQHQKNISLTNTVATGPYDTLRDVESNDDANTLNNPECVYEVTVESVKSEQHTQNSSTDV